MTTADRIHNILEQLRENSFTLIKLNILEKNKDDEDLVNFFRLALDKSIIYNIKKIPQWEENDNNVIFKTMDDVYDILKKLQNIKGNKAKELVKNFTEKSSRSAYDIFSCIIGKNPRCGVSSALVNRVWADLIPDDIKLCKAMPFTEKNFSYITYPAIVQRKCDGARCLAFAYPEENRVEFFSSNNKRYKGLEKYLADEVLAYGIGEEPYVLDGELLVRNENNEIMRRKDGNGILNKVTLGTASEEEKSRIEMVIWDKIPLYDYRKNECDTQYDFMLSCLLVENNVEPKSHVYPVETYYADSKDDVKRIFRNMVCRGEEGVIVKNKNMHWVNKRSHDAVKMKLSVEVTLKIVDVFEGTGKYAGKLGGFVCESSDGIVNVRIGSGFDDSDRERFYNDFSLVNKCVEIGFNDIVQSKDGTYSLFLPIFKNLREDKDEADSFETIKLAFDMATSLNA